MENLYIGIEIDCPDTIAVTKNDWSVSKDSATCNFTCGNIEFILDIRKITLNINVVSAEKSWKADLAQKMLYRYKWSTKQKRLSKRPERLWGVCYKGLSLVFQF